jgi:hypothetical protein
VTTDGSGSSLATGGPFVRVGRQTASSGTRAHLKGTTDNANFTIG